MREVFNLHTLYRVEIDNKFELLKLSEEDKTPDELCSGMKDVLKTTAQDTWKNETQS